MQVLVILHVNTTSLQPLSESQYAGVTSLLRHQHGISTTSIWKKAFKTVAHEVLCQWILEGASTLELRANHSLPF